MVDFNISETMSFGVNTIDVNHYLPNKAFTYIFADICSPHHGTMVAWNIYFEHPGTLYATIWKKIQNTEETLGFILISKTEIESFNSGMQVWAVENAGSTLITILCNLHCHKNN